MLAAFRRGLNGAGWVEGRNVAIEYRFADGQVERVRALGMELTARRVAVIVLVGLIANDEVFGFMKASQIPIVFNTGADPVHYGLVISLNHPGGNLTGINTLVSELTTKHIEVLHYLVPKAKTIAALVDFGGYGWAEENDARKAAAVLGLQMLVFRAVNDSEVEAVFAAVNQHGSDAMIVEANPFYVTRAKQIAVRDAAAT